jgi:uncharacterized protein YjiS (DUF1127 family)
MYTLRRRYGDTSPLTSDWLARIASAIAMFWSRRRQGRHARLMIAELQTFDDAMLKDIGIQRCQIESAVLHGARDEWYAPLTDAGWSAAPTPQTHRTVPARNSAERHNYNDV